MNLESELDKKYCGFSLNGGHYAIPVKYVQEVIKPQTVTPVPLSEAHVKGLINLRGQIVTSVSLRKLFGFEANPEEAHMNIIVRSEDSLVSFCVDEIKDVFDIDNTKIENAPATLGGGLKQFVNKVYKMDQELAILLDVEKLLEV